MGHSFVCFGATSAGSLTDDHYGPIIFLCLFHGSPCCYNKCRIHLILLNIIILLVVSVCMTDCLLLHPLLPSRDVKKRKLQSSDEPDKSSDKNKGCVEIERLLFVCESTQLMDMMEQINATSHCLTPECCGR